MAGLLYLPRIFVYHSENISDVNLSNTFKIMEKKLFYYIMTPAMILSWIFGLLLILNLDFSVLNQLWIQIKGILKGVILVEINGSEDILKECNLYLRNNCKVPIHLDLFAD